MRFLKKILPCIVAIAVIVFIFNTIIHAMGYGSWNDIVDILPFSSLFTKIVSAFTGVQYSSSAALKSSFVIDIIKFALIVVIGTILDLISTVALRSFSSSTGSGILMLIIKFGVKIIVMSVVVMFVSNIVSGINISLFNKMGMGVGALILRYIAIIFTSVLVLAVGIFLLYIISRLDSDGTLRSKILLIACKSIVKTIVLIMLLVFACVVFSNTELMGFGLYMVILLTGIFFIMEAIIG